MASTTRVRSAADRQPRVAKVPAVTASFPRAFGAMFAVRNGPWRTWLLTRGVALALGGLAVWLGRGNVFFDTTYYAKWAHGTLTGARIPYHDFAWEYPPAALPAMLLPGLPLQLLPGRPPSYHYFAAYGTLWAAFMLLVDAAAMRFLIRRTAGVPAHPGRAVWVYGLPLLGALSWARYDLLPAAFALLAVATAGGAVAQRSGRLSGLGGALKIWPVLLAPFQRTRREAVTATATAGAVMVLTAAVTFALTGETGFAQVLHYQSKRGLQIESLAALPLVWLRHLRVPGYTAKFRFGAWEVLGPGAPALATASTILYVVGLVVIGIVHWRFMGRQAGGRLVALSAMSFLTLTIVTNKVFSPQYVLWLLAVFAAATLLDPETWRPFVPWVLTATGLTAVVFPWLYGDIMRTAWLGLLVMTLRDVVVLGIAVGIGRLVVRELRAPAVAEIRLPDVATGSSSDQSATWLSEDDEATLLLGSAELSLSADAAD